MIVKILANGKSFKGLADYLTHDPKAQTEERVGWTHTLNLANDHVPSAVHEMLWTSRNAELLKQEAGIRAGGRVTENTVKHVSLNWSPEDRPTREHMIESAEGFLRHMSWQDHQVLIVAHEDKSHPHAHLMVNMVHPENGLRLDDNFERRRAQVWALEYERENGRIYCEQRLMEAHEREDAQTRPAWLAFENKRREFERDENARQLQQPILVGEADSPENLRNSEWKKLKEFQRLERDAHFKDGKSVFSELRRSVYREIREEYRGNWAELYAARQNGLDDETFALNKAALIADQKETLEKRRDKAYATLRETRDEQYQTLLDHQRGIRAGLRGRQEAGFDNALFFRALEGPNGEKTPVMDFRTAAEHTTAPREAERPAGTNTGPTFKPRRRRNGIKSGPDISANISLGVGSGLLAFFGGIADSFSGATSDTKSRQPDYQPEPSGPDPFVAAIIDASSKRQQRERDDADEDWRRKQRSPGE